MNYDAPAWQQELHELPEELRASIDAVLHADKVRYRVYPIRKSSGGTRVIKEPCPALKTAQAELVTYFQVIKLHARLVPEVVGFVKGRTIAENAMLHRDMANYRGMKHEMAVGNVKRKVVRRKYYFLSPKAGMTGDMPTAKEVQAAAPKSAVKMDLKDAFGTITPRMVREGIMSVYPLVEEDLERVVQLCCHRGSLPQGAPTSPSLMNLSLVPFDSYVRAMLQQHIADRFGCGVTYTRFADDLTITCTKERMAQKCIPIVDGVARFHKLRMNRKKTQIMTLGTGIFVTGINIVNGLTHVSVSRAYRSRVRAAIHQASLIRAADPDEFIMLMNKVRGRIAHVNSVDPVHGAKLCEYAVKKGVMKPTEKVHGLDLANRQRVAYEIQLARNTVFGKQCARTSNPSAKLKAGRSSTEPLDLSFI